jgi:hypothetical protein
VSGCLDREIEAALDRHPDAALIRSLPGMGATLTAELIAEAGAVTRFPTPDHLAAAAGLAPVVKQSGKVRYLHRARCGNKTLKRVFDQSAFCSLTHPAGRASYDRKRAEGKLHQQAVIARARRRVNVLHAMLRDRRPVRDHPHQNSLTNRFGNGLHRAGRSGVRKPRPLRGCRPPIAEPAMYLGDHGETERAQKVLAYAPEGAS